MNQKIPLVPLQIWVGNQHDLLNKTYEFLCSIFCNYNGCKTCTLCLSIMNRQHYAVNWITPPKYYTRALVEDLFHTLSFSLQSDEHYFFILEQAHLLTLAVGNSLLKSFEEPPAGYHFILLCERLDTLLPTIISRALIQYIDAQPTSTQQELLQFLQNPSFAKIVPFNKMLEKNTLAEHEIPLLLDQLFYFWSQQLQNTLSDKTDKKRISLQHILETLHHVMQQPPMPGSTKFFMRNFFIALIQNQLPL
ncbi:MAG: hypothetical protein WA432_02285 [Candidatus Babeliaceae bacterium]